VQEVRGARQALHQFSRTYRALHALEISIGEDTRGRHASVVSPLRRLPENRTDRRRRGARRRLNGRAVDVGPTGASAALSSQSHGRRDELAACLAELKPLRPSRARFSEGTVALHLQAVSSFCRDHHFKWCRGRLACV
jgi:hypothetical protein